jgi:hypothetical protein
LTAASAAAVILLIPERIPCLSLFITASRGAIAAHSEFSLTFHKRVLPSAKQAHCYGEMICDMVPQHGNPSAMTIISSIRCTFVDLARQAVLERLAVLEQAGRPKVIGIPGIKR